MPDEKKQITAVMETPFGAMNLQWWDRGKMYAWIPQILNLNNQKIAVQAYFFRSGNAWDVDNASVRAVPYTPHPGETVKYYWQGEPHSYGSEATPKALLKITMELEKLIGPWAVENAQTIREMECEFNLAMLDEAAAVLENLRVYISDADRTLAHLRLLSRANGMTLSGYEWATKLTYSSHQIWQLRQLLIREQR